jgi:NAD(P)-dependent dehydrogenase (short-subunit alcohol dehydrogenase family)
MERMGLLSGKNILITGAGRNIGRGIAIEMGKQGGYIIFAERDKERCIRLEEELKKHDVRSKGFVVDVSKAMDIDQLYRLLLEGGRNIDVLVNNVGIHAAKKKRERFNLEEWKEVFHTNVSGPMYLTNLISQMMIDRNIYGSILFLTSIHQWVIGRDPSYSSSKAALGMIIKELALSLAPHQIRVNGIAPGYVEEDSKGKALHHPYTPLYKSSINPCYIGRAAVFLASDYFSKCTTGTVIKIDAGLSLYNHLVEQFPLK